MTDKEIVSALAARHFQLIFWPDSGNQKGPFEEGWKTKHYDPESWTPSLRVGVMLGKEISPGRFLHDVDLDWAPGFKIALCFLPQTDFIFGRAGKEVSHCFYTLPEALPSMVFRDPIDGTMLLEVRGTTESGELGLQTMAPPSVWEKDGKREPLLFRNGKGVSDPRHVEATASFLQRCRLGAIGELLAKRLGHNGFGHEARLCWAGCLLRAGVAADDLILMGEALSVYCNNQEVGDVRRVVHSTVASLATGRKKVKGSRALAQLLGKDVGEKVVATILAWLGREEDFIRTPDGVIVKDNQENIRRAVRLMGYEVSYNEFSERMLISENEGDPVLLDDRRINNIWLRIDREYRFRPTFTFYEKVFIDSVYEASFHPVRDYLNSLTWDGQPRLHRWLVDYGGAIDADASSQAAGLTYLEAISTIVLVAAVRRIRHPGTKYDEMLVLESPQGWAKSSALRVLCPFDEWFSDDLPLNCEAKEVIERTLGKWIIEASDLTGGRKADRDQLKSMLSRQVDGPARMAYAHVPVERPRQFIIIGTTNSAEYLADPTGARRFWPVRVDHFNVEGLLLVRDQLWAEACVLEAQGLSSRLPKDLWDAAGQHQEERREIDAWEDLLESVVENLPVVAGGGRQQVATEALWVALGIRVENRDRMAAQRISAIMQRFGFKRTKIYIDGQTVRGYVRKAAGAKTQGSDVDSGM